MSQSRAIGIDLGTTYSCIAQLNEHGQPVTLTNAEGELSTPSVVFFDDQGQVIVGTEALRNAIASPARVVQHAKRHMGEDGKFWKIHGFRYSPVQISALILRKLLEGAREQLGEITEAVITVPAQFSDAQREATVQAGRAAGLERVEMINEPVAAALCHVLGSDGLNFSVLSEAQQILVFDLGGGTLDLAVVRYRQDEVQVIASDGDLELGGLDWTRVLVNLAAERFIAQFGVDPRETPESLQFLSLEAEQAKRSLSVRARAAITVRHQNRLKTWQVERGEFEQSSRVLLERCRQVVQRILKDNRFGWARIDTVLTTGGASRMPMVKELLSQLSGRTLNTSLSPDQSIAHGAALYAGMLQANRQQAKSVYDRRVSERLRRVQQRSVSARSLGILVRDEQTGRRVPHYLIGANSPLPASVTSVFGTVVPNQRKVHVRIVESGAGSDRPPTVLGDCTVSGLPADLPEGSEIEVTLSYDHQARVHVTAREPLSGVLAEVEILRADNLQRGVVPEESRVAAAEPVAELKSVSATGAAVELGAAPKPEPKPEPKLEPKLEPKAALKSEPKAGDEDLLDVFQDLLKSMEGRGGGGAGVSDHPILLCEKCGAELGRGGRCTGCGAGPGGLPRRSGSRPSGSRRGGSAGAGGASAGGASGGGVRGRGVQRPSDPSEQEFWDLLEGDK
ncbi:MAG: Hsp70 family protein [Planctomyces sp.]